MFKVVPPKKKLKEICTRLGPEYSIKMVDLEQVIYRRINDNFDLEVSGLNNAKKSFDATIFIWSLHPSVQIKEQVSGIKSFDELAAKLTAISQEYA